MGFGFALLKKIVNGHCADLMRGVVTSQLETASDQRLTRMMAE